MAKNNTKQQIIEATIQLLKKEKNVEQVSMRKIAREVGIAVSVINYHFQTKDNLINKAIDQYIGKVIDRSARTFDVNQLSIEERIRLNIKNAADFIASHPGISRVSILNDLQNGRAGDNSSQLFKSINKQLEEYYQQDLSRIQKQMLAQQQIATIQVLFLRHEIFKEQTGLDFFNKNDRDLIVSMLIDNILKK